MTDARTITGSHVPHLIEEFESLTRTSTNMSKYTKEQRGLDSVLPASLATPSNKKRNSNENNDLMSPHGFFSPNKTNTTVIQHTDNTPTYILPNVVSRDPTALMEAMMSGEYRHIDSTECITMMRSGQLFDTYIESNHAVQKRQWVCHYNDNSTTDTIGTLFFSEPGTKNEQTNRFLNLNKLTDIHLGRRPAMTDKCNNIESDESLCFSLYSDNRIFDLEARDTEQLCSWLFGINSIMSQSQRNIVQAVDDTEDDTVMQQERTSIENRKTMAKRYSVMQPVRQSMRNTLHSELFNNVSVPAPISDDRDVNQWAAQQQQLLQQNVAAIKRLQQPCSAVTNELKSLKHSVYNELDSMQNYIRDNMLTLNSSIRKLVSAKRDVETELVTEQNKRKKLQNQIIELQGNIRVFCRVRPGNKHETETNDPCCIEFKSDDTLVINNKSYEFDRVFDQSSTQSEVYTDVSPCVQSCMDGYNVCVFAYGQTGAGKSYTMEGPANDRGVNYRALQEVFDIIENNNNKTDDRTDKLNYSVNISVVEIYNETLRDLLLDKKAKNEPEKKLEIRTNPQGQVFIPDLTETPVTSVNQVTQLMATVAYPNRHVRGTDMNAHSSRSHLVLFVRVTAYNPITDTTTYGKLILIDLAGSERISKSGATGDSLKEAQNINSSLSALGLVINSLQNKSAHIPYRDSKLTYLLQDCLGGNSKCLMFCQLSPATTSQQESICSLQFAQRARSTELGKAKKNVSATNADKSAKLIEKLKTDSKEELYKLEKKLRSVQDQCNDKDDLIKQLQRDNTITKQLQAEIQQLKEQLKSAHNSNNSTVVPKGVKSDKYNSIRHTLKSRASVMPSHTDPSITNDIDAINESSILDIDMSEQENSVGNLHTIETTPKIRINHKRKETPSQDDLHGYSKKMTVQSQLNGTMPIRNNPVKSVVSSTRIGTARAVRPGVTNLNSTLQRPLTSPVPDDSTLSRADEMRKRMNERKQRAAAAVTGSASKKKQQWA